MLSRFSVSFAFFGRISMLAHICDQILKSSRMNAFGEAYACQRIAGVVTRAIHSLPQWKRKRARHAELLYRAGRLEKSPRQFDGSPQKAQIMAPRDLDPAKLFQMRREPLRVEQDELAGAQMFHQRH